MADGPPQGYREEPTTEVVAPIRPPSSGERTGKAVSPSARVRQPSSPAWLRVAVGVLSAVAVLGAAGLILEHLRPSAFTRLRSQPIVPPTGGRGPTAAPSTSAPAGQSTHHTTTTLAVGSPGGPRIATLSPSVAAAGATVVVTGTGLVSANGHVLVYFGSMAARTACPSESRCVATAPAGAAGATVQVRVHTASGVSNSLSFTYR